jgi:putative transposase
VTPDGTGARLQHAQRYAVNPRSPPRRRGSSPNALYVGRGLARPPAGRERRADRELCRQHQISEQTYYRWKRYVGDLGTVEVLELRQLREENRKLKQLVADLSLDKQILREVIAKKI